MSKSSIKQRINCLSNFIQNAKIKAVKKEQTVFTAKGYEYMNDENRNINK